VVAAAEVAAPVSALSTATLVALTRGVEVLATLDRDALEKGVLVDLGVQVEEGVGVDVGVTVGVEVEVGVGVGVDDGGGV
jgi:hypothetical protein